MADPTTHVTGEGTGAWFRPRGAVTGVGSVPHLDPARAIDFVARAAPELPFWPQLRRLSAQEAMLPQSFGPSLRYLTPVRGEYGLRLPRERVERFAASLERDAGRLDPANAAGFYAFVDAFRAGAFLRARAVKGQAMGPVTLSSSLLVDGSPVLERGDLRALIGDHVVRLARWQADVLRGLAPAVLIVLDEAYLGVAIRRRPALAGAVADLLRSVVVRIRKPGVLVGMHCCDEIPFSLLETVAPDVYSFDAHHGAGAMADDPCAHRFLVSGGQVAWGWIPTLDDLSEVEPAGIVERWWEASERLGRRGEGVEPARVLASSLVTASCGLAGSSEPACERSFALAAEVSRRFAARCGST